MTKVKINGTEIKVCRLPDWLAKMFRFLLRPIVKCNVGAFTLGHTVFLLMAPVDWLLLHESVHALQEERFEPHWGPPWFRRLAGDVVFDVVYVYYDLVNGYAKNPLEVDAYAKQHEFQDGKR